MSDQQEPKPGQPRRAQPPLAPRGSDSRNDEAAGPVEALAREIYIRGVKGTLTSGFTCAHLAQQAFEQAESFQRVADVRRRTQKKE